MTPGHATSRASSRPPTSAVSTCSTRRCSVRTSAATTGRRRPRSPRPRASRRPTCSACIRPSRSSSSPRPSAASRRCARSSSAPRRRMPAIPTRCARRWAHKYGELVADRDMLLGQLHAYAAGDDPVIRDAVRRSYGRLSTSCASRPAPTMSGCAVLRDGPADHRHRRARHRRDRRAVGARLIVDAPYGLADHDPAEESGCPTPTQ